MNNNFEAQEQSLLSDGSQETKIIIEKTLLTYIKHINSLSSTEEKVQTLKHDRQIAEARAINPNASQRIKTYFAKKVQAIDAIAVSIKDLQDKKPIQALFNFNYCLNKIITPSDVVRKLDGTKMPVSSGSKAKDLAWANYCKHGNDIADFVRKATPEDIEKALHSLTRINLTEPNANLQIANNIIPGKMSQDDGARFCYLMGLLCNADCGFDTEAIKGSKEYVYTAYATTYGSVDDLQTAYDALVDPRNQRKIETKPANAQKV